MHDGIIYETTNFIVEAHPKPFIDRKEGGHIRIKVKDTDISDRTQLDPKKAMELMRLTMMFGEALEKAMNKRGVRVIKINYEELGNWAHKRGEKNFLHIHIFGRVEGAQNQPYPEAVYLPDRSTGFYDRFKPLNEGDIKEIRKQIELILEEDKYHESNWRI